MPQIFIFCLIAMVVGGCSTHAPLTRQLLKTPIKQRIHKIENVTLVPQTSGDCGPSALSMVFSFWGVTTPLESLKNRVIIPGKKGALPQEMLAASTENGFVAIKIHQLESLVAEVSANHPVIVLQNLGFSWWPNWHYAVVVGYNMDEQTLILHTGDNSYKPVPMTWFERHWSLAGQWALLALPPKSSPAQVSELEYMQGASRLEAIGDQTSAKRAYETAISKWPKSLTAYLGLANIAFHEKQFVLAEKYLKTALVFHPNSMILKNNLQVVQSQRKNGGS